MTPTLAGRWQTRYFLFGVVGVPVTAVFALLYRSLTPFVLLLYVWLLGLGWDIFYDAWQRRRWDRDWPPLFAWVGGLGEGVTIWLLISLLRWGGEVLPGVAVGLTFGRFGAHYLTVFSLTWVASQSLLPVLFPRWRFRGGQWF
jgi:hypothetical protein